MHPGEAEIDRTLAHRLVSGQFPQWAHLPLSRVASAGTDNALFRLGTELVIRLPRVEWAAAQVAKEQRWLPLLAPTLPLEIPRPVAMGRPADGYPWHWSVYAWLDGESLTAQPVADLSGAALQLARFVRALQALDGSDGPPPGVHNFYRGNALAERDRLVRRAIEALRGEVNAAAVTSAWQAALDVPPWSRPPVWVHGDIHAGNLLAVNGQLSAVIDFGGLAVGDPACDTIVAWNLLAGSSRELFRTTLAADDATWARGRGWALSIALIALPYYRDSNPAIVDNSRQVIAEVLAESSAWR
ncbi:MAG: aminoglycoside phosphotransferase family protein [Pseudomonadales bacterium]